MISKLMSHRHQAVIGQLMRFLVSGALVTALGVGVYAVAALVLHWDPQVSNLLAYLSAAATGYVLHSRWSFRDHGSRTRGTVFRFAAVSLVSLGLNSLWVALCTGPLGLGPAWPIVPMLFVTPLVTFTLNRMWVFN